MLRFLIANRQTRQNFEHLAGPVEFGRGPERDGITRFIIQDGYVSKDHMRVEEQPESRVRIDNLSLRNSIRLPDNSMINTGEHKILRAPIRLTVGETIVDVEVVVDPIANAPLETIGAPLRQSRPPGQINDAIKAAVATQQTPAQPPSIVDMASRGPTTERLMEWFETFIGVQRAASGSPEFYQQTAEAIVKLVGLDRGMVILRAPRNSAPGTPTGPNRWMVQARFPTEASSYGREFSLTILDRVLNDRRTYFQSTAAPSTTESLQGVEAVVASPIFDPQDNVAGFVYGCRTKFTAQRGLSIGPLEAQVMQLLAASVGTGLVRQQHEAEAGRARVQFELFFSAELAAELQKNPQMLDGQEREITVMFCDIRGFSRISERLGPKLTCDLVADVMDRLTECVRAQDGSVVDYAGDGLMAMWNAPIDQEDHAVRACRAALAMQAMLPEMDANWHSRLGTPLKVGIGLNTGPAMVGNTGSRSRFKYGPLGHTVNLASRVEGATKQLGVPLLITGSTKAHLNDKFATRRLCKVRVVGIQGAVDFYELHAETASPEWYAGAQTYEQALALYETQEFGAACRAVYPMLANQDGQYDVPSLNLVTRAVEMIKSPPEKFDPVWELISK